jgi:hypothetical protein
MSVGSSRSQSDPPSRSYIAIAFGISYEPPDEPVSPATESKNTAFSGTSTFFSSDSPYCPRLYSPMSNALRHDQFGSGIAYGT